MATKKAEEDKQQVALARREEIAGNMAVAAGYHPGDARGKTNIDAGDKILPRIAVAQDLSPQLKEDRAEYVEGLKVGELFNTLTGENYGVGPIEFVILDVQKRALEFDDDNNVVDFVVPWNDPRCDFQAGPNGTRIPPIATRFYDFIVLLQHDIAPGTPSNEMVVLSLKRTQIPIAKKLVSLMSVRPGAAWMGKYSLGAFIDHKGKFSFGNVKIGVAGPTDPKSVAYAEACYTIIEKGAIKIDRSGEGKERQAGDEPAGSVRPPQAQTSVAQDDIPF